MVLVVGQDEGRPGQGGQLALGDAQVAEADPQADPVEEGLDRVAGALGDRPVVEALLAAGATPYERMLEMGGPL